MRLGFVQRRKNMGGKGDARRLWSVKKFFFVTIVPFFVSMSSEEGKGEHAWKRLDLCGD